MIHKFFSNFDFDSLMRTVLLAFMRFMLSDSSVATFYLLLPYLSCVDATLCSEFILLVY